MKASPSRDYHALHRKAMAAQRAEQASPAPRPWAVPKACRACGESFGPRRHELESEYRGRRFCGAVCEREARRGVGR